MDKSREIVVFLFEDVNLLDVAGPVQAFCSANLGDRERYRCRFVSLDGEPVRSSCGLRLVADASVAAMAGQDLLMPGGQGVGRLLTSPGVKKFVGGWLEPGRDQRIISVCSGALVLAATGLLDGRQATTHWNSDTLAREMFPDVIWDTEKLYISDGQILTSAGVTSGIDLALEVIRHDHGPTVALTVARELVVYLKRSGGQNQFADMLEAQFSSDPQFSKVMAAIHDRPQHNWTLDAMADVAGLTPRTLTRRFSKLTGRPPLSFLERLRVKRAGDALSEGASTGKVIQISGFADFQQMQRAFKRQLGTTVGSYVDRFGTAKTEINSDL